MLLLLTLVVMVITALPYIFGYLRTPTGTTYTGIHALTPGDFNVYYSYLEQAKQGHYLFQDLYTSEKQPYPYIQPFWLGIGLFAKVFNLPNWLAVQFSRLLLIPIFVFIAYLFISYLFSEKQIRKLAIFFLLFTSGSGAILSPFLESGKYIAGGYYHWPMDLWVPEATTFLSLYHLPHILASSILFLLVFLFVLLAFENNSYHYSILGGIVLLFWLFFHPFHFFTVFIVLVVYLFALSIIRKKIQFNKIKHFLIVLSLALPAVIYYTVMQKIDPLTTGRAIQNVLTTPVPWMLLISYGVTGMLAIAGFYLIIKKAKSEKLFFVSIWFVVQLSLLYSPLMFQRRLSQNFHFPIIILSVVALCTVYQFFSKRMYAGRFKLILENKILFAFSFLIVLAFSNLYAVANDLSLYSNNSYPYFYLEDNHLEAITWLKSNLSPNKIVLSEWDNGNFIPGISGRKVYAGHGVETIDYLKKQDEIEWFFSNDGESEKKQEFLREREIDYIFYSENEKALGSFDPNTKKYLQEVFKNNSVTIYQFVR